MKDCGILQQGIQQWFSLEKGGCSGVATGAQSATHMPSQGLGFEDMGRRPEGLDVLHNEQPSRFLQAPAQPTNPSPRHQLPVSLVSRASGTV
jgi:hypothetical protein